MSGIASTGTGSRGIIPVFQLKGAVTMPHTIKTVSKMNVTSLFSRKNLIKLFIYFDLVVFILYGKSKCLYIKKFT